MKYCAFVFIQTLLLSSVSFSVVGAAYIPTFKTLNLAKVEYADLCTGEPQKLNSKTTVDLWSIHCGNCLQKIEDSKDRNLVFINVDAKSSDRIEACNWLKKRNAKSLVDVKESIRTQFGGNYPIPTELKVHQGKVLDAVIGYWRDVEPHRK